MEGPVSLVRKACGLSLREFSLRYKISKPALTNYEAGMYPALSNAIVSLLYDATERLGISIADLMHERFGTDSVTVAYAEWLRLERLAVAGTFMMSPVSLHELKLAGKGVPGSPFLAWVERTCGSVYNFSKSLKVPQATVWRYADGKTSSMPKQLVAALTDVGYPRIEDLEAEQRMWRERYA